MKIALFVHCFFPYHFYGTETYTLQLAKNLQTLGHDVYVVTAVFQGEPRLGAFVTRYHYDGIPVWALDKNYHPHATVGGDVLAGKACAHISAACWRRYGRTSCTSRT